MTLFSPTFGGTVNIRTPRTEFLGRLRRRIDAGFLVGTPHRRSRYVVTKQTDRELTFRAGDFPTAINVGLNRVEVRIGEDSRLEYWVTYRRWAACCVAFCALIGTALIASYLLIPIMRAEIAAHNGGAAVFWGSVAFWGFVWPWLLIGLHKPFARQCLNQILTEIDTQAA
jgi:hypothetical protein